MSGDIKAGDRVSDYSRDHGTVIAVHLNMAWVQWDYGHRMYPGKFNLNHVEPLERLVVVPADDDIARLRAAGDALEFMLSFYVKHFSPVGTGHMAKEEALVALAAWQEVRRG